MSEFPPYTARYKGVRGKVRLIAGTIADAVGGRRGGTGLAPQAGQAIRNRPRNVDRVVDEAVRGRRDSNDDIRERDVTRR
jgi:hypothetical protein